MSNLTDFKFFAYAPNNIQAWCSSYHVFASDVKIAKDIFATEYPELSWTDISWPAPAYQTE